MDELAAQLHALNGKLKRRLREQASAGDLTPSQADVVVFLEREGPSTVTALAQAMGVRSQSMGATVAALETSGLVRCDPDPSDGRQKLVNLTDHCREVLRAGRALRHAWLARTMHEKLTPAEQQTLVDLLRRLLE